MRMITTGSTRGIEAGRTSAARKANTPTPSWATPLTSRKAHPPAGRSTATPPRLLVGIAIAVYVLVAILEKRFHLSASLYTILQILSLTLFEKTPILQALAQQPPPAESSDPQDQPCLPGF